MLNLYRWIIGRGKEFFKKCSKIVLENLILKSLIWFEEYNKAKLLCISLSHLQDVITGLQDVINANIRNLYWEQHPFLA